MKTDKPNWKVCMENAEKVEKLDFPHLKGKKLELPLMPCTRCGGSGYKKQRPGEYGLCECSSCGGSGKMVGRS